MKKWFLTHRKSVLLSTVLTLLPMVIGCILWNYLPETMNIHWGINGEADGSGGKAFAVFVLPAILALLNLVCLLVTALDPKQKNQNKKALGMIFWIMPLISFITCCMMYIISMGKPVDVTVVLLLLLGTMFVIMGNYLPKVKQNSTLGIKVSWTLHNEENWNKTHRFAGKLWVAGGLLLFFTMLLPGKWGMIVLMADVLIMAFAPMVYSYRIFKAHKAEGIVYTVPPKSKGQKIGSIFLTAFFVLILAGTAVLMVTGNIRYTCEDDALYVEASYSGDLKVLYEDMEAIELREAFDVGTRSIGFASLRLSVGAFQNEELKDYTLYAYNSCDSMILIQSGENWLAINAKTLEETQALYEKLLEKLEK